MPRYWCVNFDNDADLKHGIEENLWSMGYQYADDQSDSANRKAVITMNWRRLEEISFGDQFVAYLASNRFFATGTVRMPRRAKTSHDRTDTIDNYLKQRRSYHKGYVYFANTVVYEDFTDGYGDAPVRIDVERWENYVPDGIVLPIVNNVAVNDRQKAVFKITKSDFDRLLKKLAGKHKRSVVAADGPATEALSDVASHVSEVGYFSPTSLKDERQKKLREIVERRGQPEFRKKLIAAYNGRCVITGCNAVAALEAAHITPYCGPQFHHVTNGLLLRADLHTLFDLDLFGIDPETMTVALAPAVKGTVYSEYDGRKLATPVVATDAPNHEALTKRWKQFLVGK